MILQTITSGSNVPISESQPTTAYNISILQDKAQCEYQNHVSIDKVSERSVIPNEIKVSNKLCQQVGDFMEKVTVIRFNDEVITLRDRYRFVSSEGDHPVDIGVKKRVHIFKNPRDLQAKKEGKRRISKNLAKNFIKAFVNYLQSMKDHENSAMLECKMKLLSSRQKYNNSFIQRIMDDPDLDRYFEDFLNNHAHSWIQNSKIRDKEVHFEAVEVFKRLSASKSGNSNEQAHSLDCLLSFSEDSQRLSSISKYDNQSDKESILANKSRESEEEDEQNQQ